MKLIPFALVILMAASSAMAGDWWCLWCGPDATTVAPTTEPPTEAPTTAPTTQPPTTESTTTTTTTEAPTTAPSTQAPIVLNSETGTAPPLNGQGSMGEVPTPTVPPPSFIFNPFGAISSALGAVGGAVANTGSSLAGFFGFQSQSVPKTDMLHCAYNMLQNSFNILEKIGNAMPSCSVQMSGNLGAMADGMKNIADSLLRNVVMSWFNTKCDITNNDFGACIQSMINISVQGLTKSIDEMKQYSDSAMTMAAVEGKASFGCLAEAVVPILEALPGFAHSLDCVVNI